MDQRLERVKIYIDSNLEKELTLSELAAVGCLSQYHFSRIFSLSVGISPSAYIKKKRLEKAESLLQLTDLPVSKIAQDVGFITISNFNAAFKSKSGVSPRAFRNFNDSKKQQKNSKNEEVPQGHLNNNPPVSEFIKRIIEMNLNKVQLADMDVAYFTQRGSYLDTGRLWQQLIGWSIPKGLYPPAFQFFGISYDEPDIADDHKAYDVCVVLPDGFDRSDEAAQYKTVKGGDFLLYAFYDRVDRLALVYKEVVTDYMPGSKYDLDDRDFLEFVMNDPATDPEGKVRIDLYIPIKVKADQKS